MATFTDIQAGVREILRDLFRGLDDMHTKEMCIRKFANSNGYHVRIRGAEIELRERDDSGYRRFDNYDSAAFHIASDIMAKHIGNR